MNKMASNTLPTKAMRHAAKSDIDFNKPYTWKVEGIRGKVFGTHSKFLRSFKVRVS